MVVGMSIASYRAARASDLVLLRTARKRSWGLARRHRRRHLQDRGGHSDQVRRHARRRAVTKWDDRGGSLRLARWRHPTPASKGHGFWTANRVLAAAAGWTMVGGCSGGRNYLGRNYLCAACPFGRGVIACTITRGAVRTTDEHALIAVWKSEYNIRVPTMKYPSMLYW